MIYGSQCTYDKLIIKLYMYFISLLFRGGDLDQFMGKWVKFGLSFVYHFKCDGSINAYQILRKWKIQE